MRSFVVTYSTLSLMAAIRQVGRKWNGIFYLGAGVKLA
jgi:hypothetical protein